MDRWNEIRTAAYVARLGQVSAAAKALGVHRATVLRHIDVLENALGAKLFLRHNKGFTPTEIGAELLRIANATDEHFGTLQRLAAAQSTGLSGDIVVTLLDVMAIDVFPALQSFRDIHPNVTVRVLGSKDILKLEYGEAHVSIRMGKKPDDLDNVVLPFIRHHFSLYATDSYVERFGVPETPADFASHRFIGPIADAPRGRVFAWLIDNVPKEAFVLRTNESVIARDAVLSGVGIGVLPDHVAQRRPRLVQVWKPTGGWSISSWIVTHVDLHRTAKVQAFLKHLKDHI